MKTTRSPFATLLLLALFIVGLALTWFNFNIALPHTLWFQAIRQPDINAIDQMLGWGWWVCCSSRCCVTHWLSQPRLAWRPARSWG